MITTPESTQIDGAMALLRDCVGGKAGERLLIVREPDSAGYYDDFAPRIAANTGRDMGLTVFETVSDTFITDDAGKSKLVDTLSGFDHIVFFSRVGDQIRFSSDVKIPPSTMCYTLNVEALNSNFGKACYHGMSEIKHAIDTAFEQAENVRVTCPRGTDYSGKPSWNADHKPEVTLKRFPLLVPRPIPAQGMSGKIALSNFLTGTGSKVYEPYMLELPKVLFACVTDNRITHFEGDYECVQRVEAHYHAISEQFGLDPWFVDSWHAGIHPGCHFTTNAKDDIIRWSGSAFGNPRVLHFHTCGEYAPGEICWHILDPTITLDGIAVWENGRLIPERINGVSEILDRHQNLADMFQNPTTQIGFEDGV